MECSWHCNSSGATRGCGRSWLAPTRGRPCSRAVRGTTRRGTVARGRGRKGIAISLEQRWRRHDSRNHREAPMSGVFARFDPGALLPTPFGPTHSWGSSSSLGYTLRAGRRGPVDTSAMTCKRRGKGAPRTCAGSGPLAPPTAPPTPMALPVDREQLLEGEGMATFTCPALAARLSLIRTECHCARRQAAGRSKVFGPLRPCPAGPLSRAAAGGVEQGPSRSRRGERDRAAPTRAGTTVTPPP